ncbi:unnamed protein product, partial [Scytosiphon promiscuus]
GGWVSVSGPHPKRRDGGRCVCVRGGFVGSVVGSGGDADGPPTTAVRGVFVVLLPLVVQQEGCRRRCRRCRRRGNRQRTSIPHVVVVIVAIRGAPRELDRQDGPQREPASPDP